MAAAEHLRHPEPAERPQSQGSDLLRAEQIAWVHMAKMVDQALGLVENPEAAEPVARVVLTEATE